MTVQEGRVLLATFRAITVYELRLVLNQLRVLSRRRTRLCFRTNVTFYRKFNVMAWKLRGRAQARLSVWVSADIRFVNAA